MLWIFDGTDWDQTLLRIEVRRSVRKGNSVGKVKRRGVTKETLRIKIRKDEKKATKGCNEETNLKRD